MSGRFLDAVRIVPPLLWRHLGERLGVAAPDLASLRAMYRRATCRQDPTVCWRRESDGGGLVNRWNRAGILLFCGDQSTSYNQILAQAPHTAPEKYGLPLPYVIARKTRGPRH